MNALPTKSICLWFFAVLFAKCVASVQNEASLSKDVAEDKKLELLDGVNMSFPRDNGTDKLFSFDFDTSRSLTEGRSKSKKLLQRILPMFIMPFVIQSALTPFVLGMLKFMLIKAFLIGKLALTLIMFNAFRNHNSFKGRDAEMASAHYGYHGNGIEHYTTYFNH